MRQNVGNRKLLGLAIIILITGSVLFMASVRLSSKTPWTFARATSCATSPSTLDQSLRSLVNWPNYFVRLEKARRVSVTGQEFATIDQEIETGALIRLTFAPDRETRFAEDPLVAPHQTKYDGRRTEFEVQVKRYRAERELTLTLDTDLANHLRDQYRDLTWTILLDEGRIHTEVRGFPESLRSRILGTFIFSMVFLPVAFEDAKALCETTQPRPTLLVPAFQR